MSRRTPVKSGSQNPREEKKVLPFAKASSRADARLAEFLETARRFKDERATAAGVVEVLDTTPSGQWPSLATDARFQTSAALEKLGEEVRRRLARDPREALTLSELATTVADALPEDAYPAVTLAQIRAMAWKDRANTLRFLTRYEEAFGAISRAEAMLAPHVALSLDKAVVGLVKALALVDTGQLNEGRVLATECGAVFLSHGDITRAMYAGEVEGHALYEQKRFAEAESLFFSLLDIARATDDLEVAARCHSDIGFCAIERDDTRTANIHFSEAIAKLTDLGQTVAATRTQRGAGTVFIRKGHFDLGMRHLSDARESFKRFGMTEQAALCALVIAEAFLSRGEYDSARLLVSDIADQFSHFPLEHSVHDALATLQRQIVDNDVPIETLRNVFEIIESAQPRQMQM